MNEIDIKAVDLNLIKAFTAVLRTGNVTKAAKSLGIGQPAMSHALSRLRETFDDELFTRTPNGMRPTARAREIAGHVERAMAEIQQALQKDSHFDPAVESFEFTLAVSDYSECVLLPALMADIAVSAPNFKLTIMQYAFFSYKKLLDQNNVDLVIASVRQSSASHCHERLFDDRRLCMYSANQIKAPPPISLEQYLNHRHVVIARDGEELSPIDTGLAETCGKGRTVALVSPRFSTLPPVLSNAPIIATLPARISYVFQHVPALVISELPFTAPTIEQSMVWHMSAQSNPAFQWLLERVRKSVDTTLPPVLQTDQGSDI